MEDRIIAISALDAMEWGCPHCGATTSTFGTHDATTPGVVRTCWKCRKLYVVVDIDLVEKPVNVTFDGKAVELKVEAHPREGTPKSNEAVPFDEAGWETDRAYYAHQRALGRIP